MYFKKSDIFLIKDIIAFSGRGEFEGGNFIFGMKNRVSPLKKINKNNSCLLHNKFLQCFFALFCFDRETVVAGDTVKIDYKKRLWNRKF